MPGSRVRTSEHEWGTLVELCAPEVRNALDAAAVADLAEAFRAQHSGVVVLTGAGRDFCAGGDVSALASASRGHTLADLLTVSGAAFADLVEAIVSSRRPVVAAVRGAVVGGGISLALACDVRVAGRSTRLVPGWGRWGLPPDGCVTALLASAVGPAAAAAFTVRGEQVTTDSPLAPLLFSEVVPDDDVVPVAIDLARRIAANPGAAAAKAVTRPLLLPLLRSQRAVELTALVAAAHEPDVVAALGAPA